MVYWNSNMNWVPAIYIICRCQLTSKSNRKNYAPAPLSQHHLPVPTSPDDLLLLHGQKGLPLPQSPVLDDSGELLAKSFQGRLVLLGKAIEVFKLAKFPLNNRHDTGHGDLCCFGNRLGRWDGGQSKAVT